MRNSSPLSASRVAETVSVNTSALPPPRVWVLLGYGAGGNAQLLQLARALGWPYEAKRMRYNALNRCPNLLLGASRLTVDTRNSEPLEPPWPDLLIAASRRAAPVARWIKRQSAGHTRLVHLLHTQAPLHHFDLVVTTPQYRLPQRANVLHNLLPLNVPGPQRLAQAASLWQPRLAHLPRPWIAVLVGGNSSSYRLDAPTATRLGQTVTRMARESGGSLLITTSPRTPPAAADALLAVVDAPAHTYRWQAGDERGNPYAAYLALADRFIVTADSASLVAEACASGRPVALFEWAARRRPAGGLRVDAIPGLPRLQDALIYWGLMKPRRDFRALHHELTARGLLQSPGHTGLPPPRPDELAHTVARIRQLMEEN